MALYVGDNAKPVKCMHTMTGFPAKHHQSRMSKLHYKNMPKFELEKLQNYSFGLTLTC